MIRRIHLALIALMLAIGGVCFPGGAQAQGIEQRLNDAFDAMANYTPPSVSLNARRGVISGGSMTIRTPNVGLRPFSLRGPSISVGCGGIDMFFGSFSFISKEQLVQAMRAIVTAALTYAFQIALEAMCPSCANVLGTLQDWLNQANEMLTNSCEATRNLMDQHGIKAAIKNAAESWRTALGTAKDPSDAKNQGATNSSVKAATEESTRGGGGANKDVRKETVAEGNQVWQVLKRSPMASFGFDSNEFFEEIMSMTGTVIVCMPDDNDCAEVGTSVSTGDHIGQDGELQVWRRPPIMTLRDLVMGKAANSSVKQYRCVGDYEKCRKIEVATNPMVGMATQIRQAFNGTIGPGGNPTGGSPGILWKVRFNYSSAPTAEEEKWLKVGGSLSAMAIRLAQKDLNMARGFVDDNAEAIAAEIILDYVSKYLLGANVALGRANQDGLDYAYELISQSTDAMRRDAKEFYEKSNKSMAMYQAFLARSQAQL